MSWGEWLGHATATAAGLALYMIIDALFDKWKARRKRPRH